MLEINLEKKSFQTSDDGLLTVIDDLSISVADGEFVCIIGPSGCGKTTLLRAVLGLDTDFEGSIRPDTGSMRIGAVFQEPRLLPWRTVEQNVRLALPASMEDLDLTELFETLGLSTMRNFFPGQLSLGLARRAAIARAFAIDPGLLVLDEPFVSLDSATASRLRKLLIDVWSKHRTTALMVTHDLQEAVELADRIILLTPPPAKLRGIVEIEEPRGSRDSSTIARTVDAIAAEYPGVA